MLGCPWMCTLGMAVSDVRAVYLIKLSDTLCIETYSHSVPKGKWFWQT